MSLSTFTHNCKSNLSRCFDVEGLGTELRNYYGIFYAVRTGRNHASYCPSILWENKRWTGISVNANSYVSQRRKGSLVHCETFVQPHTYLLEEIQNGVK